MTFSGRVTEISHMGGLLISFEGRSPNLGDVLRINGGKILGRVDTVFGPVDSGFVHVHPVYNNVDVKRAIGSPVEIAPKKARGPRNQKGAGKRHGRRGSHDDRRSGGRSNFSGSRGRGGGNSSSRYSKPEKRGGHPSRGRGRRRSR